jgi:pyruvate ferredoxin oxidoreductase beta subunit
MKDVDQSLISHGISTCAGCALELAARHVIDVLGPNTVIVIPPGCAALLSGFGSETALRIPGLQGNLENSAAYAAGIRAGFELQNREEVTVLALAGDGGTVDIGLQALSGAFERGDRILYVCYDNEAYMNTGIQGSGSTPLGAATTTTPGGKDRPRKDMLAIAAAHKIPYLASASVGYVRDLRKKIEKATATRGPSYIHIHTPCPTGWGYPPAKTIEVARAAVQTGAWPLYEVENGETRITVKVGKLRPAAEYLKPQGRFRGLREADLEAIQAQMTRNVEALLHHCRQWTDDQGTETETPT